MLLARAVASEPAISRVIIDPSALFTEEALAALYAEELRPFLVVSKALPAILASGTALAELADFGVQTNPQQLARVRDALAAIDIFSQTQANAPDGARRIVERLLADPEPGRFSAVLADEWAFMTSQSLGWFGDIGARAFGTFKKAGGLIHEVSDEAMRGALAAVHESVPPVLAVMKVVGNVGGRPGHAIAVGGGLAMLFIPPLAIPGGLVVGIKEGLAVIAGDP